MWVICDLWVGGVEPSTGVDPTRWLTMIQFPLMVLLNNESWLEIAQAVVYSQYGQAFGPKQLNMSVVVN